MTDDTLKFKPKNIKTKHKFKATNINDTKKNKLIDSKKTKKYKFNLTNIDDANKHKFNFTFLSSVDIYVAP